MGRRKRGSVGRARDGVELRVVDAETGDAVPLGDVPAVAVTLVSPVTEQELMEYLGGRLASYQRPVAIRVVQQLPRTPSLKVSRALVRGRYFRSLRPEDLHHVLTSPRGVALSARRDAPDEDVGIGLGDFLDREMSARPQ